MSPTEEEKASLSVEQNVIDVSAKPPAGTIDRIRDILFGNQVQEYERRLARLEAQVVTDNRGDQSPDRLAALGSYVQSELAQVKSLAQELKTTVEALRRGYDNPENPNSRRSELMSTPEEENYLPAKTEVIGGGNLDKVRDLIFGNQMRDYEKRFARLEERMLRESANLRDDTKNRLDSLDGYLKQELDTLSTRLKTEQSDRDTGDKDLAEGIRELSLSSDKKIAQLDELIAQNQREARQRLQEQSNALRDEIRQRNEDVLTTLEKAIQELRSDKTDRATLASLLQEVAIRLNSDFSSSQ
jgi:vacuolar-type H+-ATPase subunit H